MRARRAVRLLAPGAAAVLTALLPSATHGHSGLVLRGFGTATVDGALSAGEWEAAARHEFALTLPAHEGGASVPASLLLMNDASRLYVAIRIPRGVRFNSYLFAFDNNHDGRRDPGDEFFLVQHATVSPMFEARDSFAAVCSPAPPGVEAHCPFLDTTAAPDLPPPGTLDLRAAHTTTGAATTLELSHPLDSADDRHDFSLRPGNRVGLLFATTVWSLDVSCNEGPTCFASTSVPAGASGASAWADVRITSLNRTPPETFISGGPASGAFTADRTASFEFTGSDDAIAAGDLEFECSLDGGAFSPCASPKPYDDVAEGAHTFAVRAIDEAGNVDATPATREWTVDTTPPRAPRVSGPRTTASRRPVYRLSARDAATPTDELRYRCSVDSARLRECRTPYRPRLSRGVHVLRFQAIDAAGNASRTTRLRVVVR